MPKSDVADSPNSTQHGQIKSNEFSSNGCQSYNSTNVLISDGSHLSRSSKIRKEAVSLICNKANISNFLTFILMITGITLVQIYQKSDDEISEDWYDKAFKLLRAFGLFGFAGGMTNWLAIRMMFDKIPCLIGSGVLLRHFIEIRENVKRTTMSTYFDAGHLSVYVTQKTEIILNALQLEESIRDVIRSPPVQALIDDKIEEVFQTPEGLVLGVMVSKQKVKDTVMPSIENIGTDIVPLVSQLVRSSEHLTEDNLREQIDRLITSKLVDMHPEVVVAIVKGMVETELGWVIIWGNIFGGILGLALELVTILY